MEANNYWNIDSFLAEEEPVTAKLNTNAKGLAYLDAQAAPGSEDIEKDKEVKLPLWLALMLAEREYAEINAPAYLGKAYKGTMKAD